MTFPPMVTRPFAPKEKPPHGGGTGDDGWRKPVDKFELQDGDYIAVSRDESKAVICQLKRDPDGHWRLVRAGTDITELKFTMPDTMKIGGP